MSSEKKPNLGNVLVTGGCGFLGHHIIRVALRDWETTSLTVVDLKCDRNRRPDADGVQYHELDITDPVKVVGLFERLRPDVVIHTASPPAQGHTTSPDELFRRVNIGGTQNIVDACRKAGVKALVYTSSASVLSDNVSDLVNADERWPVPRGKDQTEYYSETKASFMNSTHPTAHLSSSLEESENADSYVRYCFQAAAEEIVLNANRIDGSKLLTTSIRPAGIVGEGDVQAQYHIIALLQQGRDRYQMGDNNNLFDFTYVENVAHAHLLAVHALLATHAAATAPLDYEKVDGEAFIITNDSPLYFWDFTRLIWNAAGSLRGTEHVWVIPKDVGVFLGWCVETVCWMIGVSPTFNRMRITYSTMTRYFNIDKAKRRLGYAPIISLEEGMRRSVKWTLAQGRPDTKSK